MASSKKSGKRRGPRRKRVSTPTDWLLYLEPLVVEIETALEIVRRLRWAVELSKLGVSEAPGPLPGCRNPYRPQLNTGLVEGVLLPEEMFAKLKSSELRELLREWEVEIREWAQGIWKRRGDTLRLREKRRRYVDAIDKLKNGPPEFSDPKMSAFAVARLVNDLESRPGEERRTKRGVGVMHAHAFTDPFGNQLPPCAEKKLLDETEDERAAPHEDDRALRRLVKGESKKADGGVRGIDPRLLRSKRT